MQKRSFQSVSDLSRPALFALMLAATACGGGGGGGSGSSSDSSSSTTVTVPGAPTITSATAGDGYAKIAFSAPSSNGGATITSYTASCSSSADSQSASNSASPITVSSLTNDTTYSCTVAATNSAGTGSSSSAVSVTPSATSSGSTDCDDSTTQGALLTCLADEFRSTLSSSELSAVSYSLTESNATQHWSNLPAGAVQRLGLALGDLSSSQRTAADELLAAALTSQGETTKSELLAADDYLGARASGYGSDLYYISFLGTPSTASAWLMIFSGHHYTFVVTVNGDFVSMTPNFVGVEPVTWTSSGTTHTPMASRHDALLAMLNGLSSSELSSAKLSQAYGDVLVGPQNDGNFPSTPQGVAVSTLTSAQRDLVAAAIKSYSDDADGTGQTDAYVSDSALDDTYIAWASYSDLSTRGSYVRIDGPRVWIELTVQSGVIFSANHYHSIWRDKELDYGGEFSF